MSNSDGNGTSKKVVLKTEKRQDTATTAFYSQLPSPVATFLEKTADLIREGMNHSLIEIGTNLRLVKDKELKHGQFRTWLKVEFQMTERTAQRYMSAARLAAKYDMVSHLPPTALYALSAPTTPPSARKKVLERLKEGDELEGKEIIALIREEKKNEAAGGKCGTALRHKPAGHVVTAPRKLVIGCSPEIEKIIQQRLPPADEHVFWARVKNHGGKLVISRLRPVMSHGRSK